MLAIFQVLLFAHAFGVWKAEADRHNRIGGGTEVTNETLGFSHYASVAIARSSHIKIEVTGVKCGATIIAKR